MSDITLSAAVRSNLLSLQNTASLLDTTQTRLATGNKVNSALDNPTNYFTASALNSRASDLGNLLDGVSNAIQTIQAANDGITSITKLVASAQATANQAQQLSETITANTAATITGNINFADDTNATTTGTLALGTDVSATAAGTSAVLGSDLTTTVASAADTLTIGVGSKSLAITFNSGSGNSGAGTAAIGIDIANAATDTVAEVTAYIQTQLQALGGDAAAATVGIVSGKISISSGVTTNKAVTIADATTGSTTNGFGLTDGTYEDTNTAITGLAGKALSVTVGTATTNLTFGAGNAGVSNKTELLNLLGGTASISGGFLKITAANTTDKITVSGNAAASLGVASATATSAAVKALTGSVDVSVNGGTSVSVALGSLNSSKDLADAFTAAGVTASVDAGTGDLTITGKNSSDKFTLTNGASGTVSELGTNLVSGQAVAPVLGQANPARAAYIAQYNGLLDQIDQLTADAGYNGNNLLAGTGSQLKVLFNEAGTSSLTISGKDTTASGLGLSKLTLGTEFDTNTSITALQGKLKTATDTLRSDASSFGSNLSIVQTRQDFTKSLINTLQTGASNLTLADSNEEAANLLRPADPPEPVDQGPVAGFAVRPERAPPAPVNPGSSNRLRKAGFGPPFLFVSNMETIAGAAVSGS